MNVYTHHSNVKCDDCGERHHVGNREDCIAVLKEQRDSAEARVKELEEERDKLRDPVRWFAGQMEARLKENDHKGGWSDESTDWLFGRLLEEAEELRTLIDFGQIPPPPEFVIHECADVANFAMMIADDQRTFRERLDAQRALRGEESR